MSGEEFKRPSPEALLDLARKTEAEEKRGKLTIYFGAAPGVGKTYAMLSDARLRRQDGVDVVVGYVETHGRPETEALLEGLEILPPLVVEYKGVQLREVDLGKVLARKPRLVLVDEMAHTDAPGLRNAKRYQDIEEMLSAGMDVYTTLNVQHMESLNDIIFQITTARVRETVPDTIIEAADEIKLIDLPSGELIKRLHEGKVYVKDMAAHAVQNFFRPSNLLALRQLALRAVAGSVDEKISSYLETHAIAGPWPVKERVLAGVFASPYSEKLIRGAFRLATDVDAELIAIYVETDRHKRLSTQEKEWLDKALDLAKTLGARLVWIKGNDVTQVIADYALTHNVTKIVIGKPRRFELFYSIPQKIVTKTPNIDIYLLDAKMEPRLTPRKKATFASWTNYLISVAAVVGMSCVSFLVRHDLNQVNLLSLFLLPVIFSALYLGRGPSIFATILSVLIFDYLFVQPYFTFAISDIEYFLTFAVYVTIALIISNLAYRLRGQIESLRQSEAKNTALYGLSRDLVSAHTVEEALAMLLRNTTQIIACEMAIFLPINGSVSVEAKTPGFKVDPKILGVASWVLNNKKSAGRGTSTLPQEKALYLPMMAADKVIGVAGFLCEKEEDALAPENQIVMETIARLGAMAVERIKSQ
jgi:two-component system sensor histidine kinase KdpD